MIMIIDDGFNQYLGGFILSINWCPAISEVQPNTQMKVQKRGKNLYFQAKHVVQGNYQRKNNNQLHKPINKK